MTFLNLKTSKYIIPFYILISCTNNKVYTNSNNVRERGDLLELYLESKKEIIDVPKDVNIYFIHNNGSYRCSYNPIEEVAILMKEYKNNIVIMSSVDSLTMKTLEEYGDVYIDKISLRKYGLIAPENQLFIIRDDNVIFKTLLDTENHNKNLRKVKKIIFKTGD